MVRHFVVSKAHYPFVAVDPQDVVVITKSVLQAVEITKAFSEVLVEITRGVDPQDVVVITKNVLQVLEITKMMTVVLVEIPKSVLHLVVNTISPPRTFSDAYMQE